MLDIKVCESINALLEKLTTTGKDILDTTVLKEFLTKAGNSEEYLKFCHEKILQQLEKNHSEIRYGTILVVEQLFKRSKMYREFLLMDFDAFLELTVETNFNKLLPKPHSIARKLKTKTLQLVQYWNSEFGNESNKISMAYLFLKTRMKVDFEDALKRTKAEVDLVRRTEERQRKITESKIQSLKIELEENSDEISRVVTEITNCFSLLIPKPDNFFGAAEEGEPIINEQDVTTNEVNDTDIVDLREHGLGLTKSTVTIQLPNDAVTTIQRTEDNEIVFEKLQESYLHLKNRLLPKIKNWLKIITKGEDTELFKKIIDMKEMVQTEISRYEELKIYQSKNTEDETSSDTDDSDFEEVPPSPEKEGFEKFAVEPLAILATPKSTNADDSSSVKKTQESSSWSLWGNCDNDPEDPTTLGATKKKLISQSIVPENDSPQPSTSKHAVEKELTRKDKLLQQAPKVPYDIDLYHWEDENLVAPSIELVESDSHRFWQPSDREGEVIESALGVSALRTRTIEFSGKFEPVKWICRVMLPSGKLCPRKDRVKCPFHGKIIERDEFGIPVRPDDALELEVKQTQEELNRRPDWQDPAYLKDLEAELGIDLTLKEFKKGSKCSKTFAEKYPGLTDIEKEKKTSRARLAKKVLSRNSLKRVGQALDEISHKKHRDKFGDQYNYAYNE